MNFTQQECCLEDVTSLNFFNTTYIHLLLYLKGTVLSQSEQTFNRAWNWCPSLR